MRYICTSIVATLMLAATSATFAGTTECGATAKLTPDDGATYDCFGSSVAIDAGVAVIGAQRTDTPDSNPGSAYVFEQQADGAWQQTAKLTADDGASYDFFGWSVALDAGVAVIGAYGDDDIGTDSGSAYVYEQQGDGTWQQTAKLTADDGDSDDYFGYSVATSGGVAVIGAYGDYDNGSSCGSAYVYEQQADGTWQQTAKLTADDGASYDNFGHSVATSGGVAVIGAYGDDDNGPRSGSAYVYEQQADGTWQQIVKLTPDDGASDDRFGYSVATSGGVAVIGAHYDDDNGDHSGSAYVFEQQADGTWQQVAKLTADDGASEDWFGYSVSNSGGVAVIGAHYDDDNGHDSGSAYVYEQQADGVWQQTAKLTADDGAAEDKFGYSVATSGGVAVIGSKDDDGDNGGYSFGSAYVYEPIGPDCNGNGIPDECDVADQTSYDCNQNGIPDECESDCDGDGVIDDCDNDPDSDGDGIPDNCETDCNGNTIPDHFEIEQGWAPDCNGNGVPDECDLWDSAYDCDDNGAIDSCEIADDPGLDCDGNGTLDACDPLDDTTDCDGNGLLDICEIAVDPSLDCDGSGVLDTCELVYEYVEREKILASDGAPEENLGHGLSIEGDVAIVGARFDDDRGYHAGSAYVFKRQADGSWMEMGKLYGDDTTEEDVFGVGVSISNGRVAIGASYDDGQGGGSTGSVYIFDQQADGSWIQGDKILAPDGLIDAVFGTDVSLDGDRLLIGAPLDDDPAINVGSAFIYERNKAGQWIQQAKLQASDGDGWRYFGVGAALSGDIAMVGAPKYDGDTGVVYVFERQADGVWLETGKISASDGIGGDVFGGSIDIDGHRMMSCSNRGSGSLYVYERDNTGSWIELGNVSNPDVADGESFGYDVCLDGNQLLAGAHGAANENGVGAGEFYVMARTSELDCDANKISDFCEIEADPSLDCDSDGILDSCAIAEGLVEDCDQNGLVDSCEIADDPLLDQNNNGLLDQCECLADIAGGGEPGDGDGVVDVNDVLAVIGFWGSAGPIGDINFDGFVGVNDLLFVLNEWGPCE